MNLATLGEYARLGVQSPSLAVRKLIQGYNRLRHRERYNINGIDIMAKDWDNLVVLDACRYDMFVECNTIDGNLSAVESRGSATAEWLYGNFHNRELWDTVYITGNPMLYRRRDEVNVEFHDVIEVWQGDGWDDEEGTVLPETMADAVRRAEVEYPNKRLLCHFMQPHYPFIGSDGEFGQGFINNNKGREPWLELKTGELDVNHEMVWNAYTTNLKLVLPAVRNLVRDLIGKSVVTSDHGNMLGERVGIVREWGHPPTIYSEQLVKTPWLECPVKNRRDIESAEPVTGSQNLGSEKVNDRLESLGYTG